MASMASVISHASRCELARGEWHAGGMNFPLQRWCFLAGKVRQLVEVQLLLAFKDSVCVLCVYCSSAVNDGIIFHQYVST